MARACARPKICSGSLRHRITVERRTLQPASVGSAEPEFDYSTVHTCRAHIETKGGVSQWNKVEINGTQVSHVFTIRPTSTRIDIRDRIRDIGGKLYAILSIEDQDEFGDLLKLYCALQGDETRRAAL